MHTTRFWNNLHHVRSKSRDWKAKYFIVLGAIKPKGLNRMVKIGEGHPCLSEEKLSFINNYGYIILIKYSALLNKINQLNQLNQLSDFMGEKTNECAISNWQLKPDHGQLSRNMNTRGAYRRANTCQWR